MKIPSSALAALLGLPLLSWYATGEPGIKPHFEVASVKPFAGTTWTPQSPAGEILQRYMRTMAQDVGRVEIPMANPGRIAMKGADLLSLLAMAYRTPTPRISGPKWMAESLFDITAKVPAGTQKEDVRLMLQSLLEERFGLTLHRETREVAGYALLVGKGGAKLALSTAPEEPPPADEPPIAKDPVAVAQDLMGSIRKKAAGGHESIPRGAARFPVTHFTSGRLAEFLSRYAEAPVVDMTGLKGSYDFILDVDADFAWSSFFLPVERLGLKLESRRVSVDTLVVDKVERTPTPN